MKRSFPYSTPTGRHRYGLASPRSTLMYVKGKVADTIHAGRRSVLVRRERTRRRTRFQALACYGSGRHDRLPLHAHESEQRLRAGEALRPRTLLFRRIRLSVRRLSAGRACEFLVNATTTCKAFAQFLAPLVALLCSASAPSDVVARAIGHAPYIVHRLRG